MTSPCQGPFWTLPGRHLLGPVVCLVPLASSHPLLPPPHRSLPSSALCPELPLARPLLSSVQAPPAQVGASHLPLPSPPYMVPAPPGTREAPFLSAAGSVALQSHCRSGVPLTSEEAKCPAQVRPASPLSPTPPLTHPQALADSAQALSGSLWLPSAGTLPCATSTQLQCAQPPAPRPPGPQEQSRWPWLLAAHLVPSGVPASGAFLARVHSGQPWDPPGLKHMLPLQPDLPLPVS
ncbi:hypothetical protein AAY473_028084 [Plecturocebus cupreus]